MADNESDITPEETPDTKLVEGGARPPAARAAEESGRAADTAAETPATAAQTPPDDAQSDGTADESSGEKTDTSATDKTETSATDKPAPNMTLSKGKNPATGKPWKPLTRVTIGNETKPIDLPPVEVQTAGAFYHDRAADICANFGAYKLTKGKGE